MDSHSLAKNSFYNVLYKILNIAFPLITSMYIARVLKAESIGKVAAAQNIVSYFTLVAAMGIPTYGVKLIAQYKRNSFESSKAFSELFVINGTLSIICTVLYYGFITLSTHYDGKETLYYITGLNVAFNIFNVDWFYQGIQDYQYITVRSFLIKTCSLIALLFLVKSENDFYIYAFISSGAIVGNYIFNIIHIRKYVTPVWKDLEFKHHLQHILVLFAASIAVEVYVLADTTMLDVMCSSTIVGYYSMSTRIIRLIRSLVVAVSSVFLPQLSHYYFNGQKKDFISLAEKGLHILCAISIPVAIGLFLVADDAILLIFGEGFINSVLTTRILAVSIVTVAFSNYIGMQILITIGKERITTVSTVCGAFVNIVLNYILIRAYQHNGAAIASVITEALVMVIQLILSHKYVKLHTNLKKIIISSMVMAAFVFLITQLQINYRLRLPISCISGATVYYGCMLLLKDSFAVTSTQRILGFLKRGNKV